MCKKYSLFIWLKPNKIKIDYYKDYSYIYNKK